MERYVGQMDARTDDAMGYTSGKSACLGEMRYSFRQYGRSRPDLGVIVRGTRGAGLRCDTERIVTSGVYVKVIAMGFGKMD